MNINVDCASTTGTLTPFWNSTGFTPATLLLTADMRQQVMFWGSIPRQGLHNARVHYLLELVGVEFEGEGAPRYDWSRLDQALDLLVWCGMAPIFELMGNPNGQFSDFNDDLQLRRWRNLVRDLVLHLVERYGVGEVKSWAFETWNEPDIGFGWRHQWPEDTVSFCRYYDACVDGLDAAYPGLVIGGPATCQTLSPLFRAFLEHCERGTNTFTGRPGTRLDFLSVHEKARKAHKEDLNPRTQEMIEREIRIVKAIRERYPHLARLPFMNNECDPQVGWKDHHTWHAAPYYAAWMCKSVFEHLEQLVDGMQVKYALLGNDHGFLGEWGHRTLLARFGQASWIEDGQGGHADQRSWEKRDFNTPEFCLVKKPAFNAMTLLSLLVDGSRSSQRLSWQAGGNLAHPNVDARLGAIATRGEEDEGITVLLFYSRDRILSEASEVVTLHLEHLPFRRAVLAHYRIDEEHGNPYAAWEEADAPGFPSDELLAEMRRHQEPDLFEEPREIEIEDGRVSLMFDLPLHGVSLVLLLPQPEQPPSPVTGLRIEDFSRPGGQTEHLLHWDALSSRAVRTYEVLLSPAAGEPFERIDTPDLLCSAVVLPKRAGNYCVIARDYWGRKGGTSNIIHVGPES